MTREEQTRPTDNVESGLTNTERVQSIFAEIAAGYDRFNLISSFGIDRLWRRAVVRMAALTPNMAVVDLAAGTGDLSMALARLGRPASVLGTDFSPEMLEFAKGKAAAYRGTTQLRFEVQDAQSLSLPDETFDVATVAFGVRNFPDRAANFREVLRVLKPGGRYIVLEFSRPPFAPFRWVYHLYLDHVIPLLGGLIVPGERVSFAYLNHSIKSFPVQEKLATELKAAGFRSVTWRNLTFGIVAVHIAVK
jgi:demethylmenaquinone methyltransferase/2-methoxy-6-polyprenyl-1,4-benzoquinol methylase